MPTLINRVLVTLYRSVRRLGIIDITKLMYVRSGDCPDVAAEAGYEIRVVDARELERLHRDGVAPDEIGDPARLAHRRRSLVVAFHDESVASFVWLIRGSVDGLDNFSRSAHLGVSIDMPEGTAMVYNAWTSPAHRGRRLIAAILLEASRQRVVGASSLLASIDWSNVSSLKAFGYLGMRPLGTVVRFGCGRLQLSLVPKQSLGLGILVAGDAPGYKFAV